MLPSGRKGNLLSSPRQSPQGRPRVLGQPSPFDSFGEALQDLLRGGSADLFQDVNGTNGPQFLSRVGRGLGSTRAKMRSQRRRTSADDVSRSAARTAGSAPRPSFSSAAVAASRLAKSSSSNSAIQRDGLAIAGDRVQLVAEQRNRLISRCRQLPDSAEAAGITDGEIVP